MPNHIKSRIEIIGTDEQVKELVERFSTLHEKVLRRTHDDKEIICKEAEGDFVGWYNEKEGTFRYSKDRNTEVKTKGLPKGIEYEYIEEFVQMPDFEKVVPTPEILKNTGFHTGIISRAKNAMGVEADKHELISRLEISNRTRDCFTPVKESDIEDVIKAIKAFKETGCFYWYDWNHENWGTKWNSYDCEQITENTFMFETAWCGVPDLIKKVSLFKPEVTIKYLYADEDTGCNTGDMIIKDGEVVEDRSPENESSRAYELYLELNPDCGYVKLLDGKYQYVEED